MTSDSQYPTAFDDIAPDTDRDAPSLADVLNQIQLTIGIIGAFNFATIGAPDFETSVRANSLNQMAAPTSALNLNGQIATNQAPGVQETDSATVQQAKNGWLFDTNAWTFVSAYVFTTGTPNGNFVYTKGARVMWMESGVTKYGVVKTSSGTSPTTVTLVANTDYSMTVSPDANSNFLSYGTPLNFPTHFNFAMNWTGFSGQPVTGTAVWSISDIGFCDITFIQLSDGTSNSTSTSCVAPIASTVGALNYCAGVDNGSTVIAIASIITGTTIGFGNGLQGGAWTASGSKSIEGFQLRYLI